MTQEFCSDSRRIIGRIPQGHFLRGVVILRNLWYNEEAGQKNKSDGMNLYFRGPKHNKLWRLTAKLTALARHVYWECFIGGMHCSLICLFIDSAASITLPCMPILNY